MNFSHKKYLKYPPFYSLEEFPKLKVIADNWEIIREEFLYLNVPMCPIDRVDKTHSQVMQELSSYVENGGAYGWVLGWNPEGRPNKNWYQYGLVINDQQIPYLIGMSKTIELLSNLRGIHVCALSKMSPHTYLPTHNHPELREKNLLQFHVTIEVDQKSLAYLNVDGEFKQNTLGSSIIFDGTYDHFAINATDKSRTILYIEFEKDL